MFFVHCILLRYIYRYCIELPIHSYQCIGHSKRSLGSDTSFKTCILSNHN